MHTVTSGRQYQIMSDDVTTTPAASLTSLEVVDGVVTAFRRPFNTYFTPTISLNGQKVEPIIRKT